MSSLNSEYFFANSNIILPFSYINKKTGIEKILTDNITNFYYSTFYNHVYSTIKVNNKDIKFRLSTERHATYLSQYQLQQKLNDNNEQYSLDYIGINRAILSHKNFSLNTKESNNNNYNLTFFAIDNIINYTELERFNGGFSDYTEEIGFNIIKGNGVSKVVVEEDENPFDPDDDNPNEEEYDNDYDNLQLRGNEEKLSDDYVLKNSGYEVEEYTNLIYQLKNKNIINSYTFMIKYNDNKESGEIIIGGLPHEYDPNHYSEKYFIYDTVPLGLYPPFSWHTNFDMIKYGDVVTSSMKNVKFSLDFGFIISSITYRDTLVSNFFGISENKNYCKEEFIEGYNVFSCQESVIKNFKGMAFYLSTKYYSENKNNKLEFTYKDLFVKSSGGDRYYFLIIFKGMNGWVFGKPLFKKYPTIFDQDKKLFGFYIQTGEYKVKEETKNSDFNYSLFIIIILAILVVVLGALLYKFAWKILPRKKKANELLDDNFEYNCGLDDESGQVSKN